jgi:hypothetical protein
MLLKSWRFATVMLVALSMATAMCHLLELPAKIGYDAPLWLTLLHTLYPPTFGTVGAAFEVGAIVTSLVLAWLVRRRGRVFAWTLAGALCMVAAHVAFWVWIAPVNATLGAVTPDTLPPDWTSLRDRWEYTHAARALLQVLALGAVVWSILVDTGPAPPRGRA